MSEVIASPSVRALAREKGIDLTALAKKLGRKSIAREDLAKDNYGAAPKPRDSHWDIDHARYGPVTEEPMSRIAQVAAANLSAANAMVPSAAHFDRADVSKIEKFRLEVRAEAEARETKLTALAFHVKALARALHDFPRLNASLSPDGKTLTLKGYCHIGFAVNAPHGLVVPVIRNADKKGIWLIASEISELAKRGRNRSLRPKDMGGGSITISNVGGIGGTSFTPIVNPPEVAILGLARTEIVPKWDGEVFRPLPMTPISLSYDHRVINGADAAQFVSRYAGLLADPRRIMI